MLLRGGELLHVHKELLDEIFTELDLNELGVLSFTEIWYFLISSFPLGPQVPFHSLLVV
jgi:hypothetical protein